MDYEKRYKEAIELMKDCIPDADGLVHVRPQDIFPELEESEDERIREAMIDFFKHEREEGIVVLHYGVNIESMIAWLEKQGEKKAAWTPMDEQRVENLLAIIEGHGYPGEVAWLNSLKDRVQPKQEWNEEDKIMLQYAIEHFERQKRNCIDGGDRKKSMQEFIDWLKFLKYRVQPQQEWSEEDEQTFIKSVEALEDFGKFELADWLKEHKGGIKL
jgi:hypothetical protein